MMCRDKKIEIIFTDEDTIFIPKGDVTLKDIILGISAILSSINDEQRLQVINIIERLKNEETKRDFTVLKGGLNNDK